MVRVVPIRHTLPAARPQAFGSAAWPVLPLLERTTGTPCPRWSSGGSGPPTPPASSTASPSASSRHTLSQSWASPPPSLCPSRALVTAWSAEGTTGFFDTLPPAAGPDPGLCRGI